MLILHRKCGIQLLDLACQVVRFALQGYLLTFVVGPELDVEVLLSLVQLLLNLVVTGLVLTEFLIRLIKLSVDLLDLGLKVLLGLIFQILNITGGFLLCCL